MEHTTGPIIQVLLAWIEVAAIGLELLAVGIIVVVTLVSSMNYVRGFFAGKPRLALYDTYKVHLGRGLLLGLEVLVAADVVLTVVLEPTLESVAFLGILVLVRIFLGWSIVVEIEHRWPWQRLEGVGEHKQG